MVRPNSGKGASALLASGLTTSGIAPSAARRKALTPWRQSARMDQMKIKNSLRALMTRDRNNRMVRRKGRIYIINKKNPRYKARQG